MCEVWPLRLRALLARAHGDAADYVLVRDRYRNMARPLGFGGHIAWGEGMHDGAHFSNPRRRNAFPLPVPTPYRNGAFSEI
jgi:hypothetical protein